MDRPSKRLWIIAGLLLTFAYILFFGFRTREWDNENRARWSSSGSGIEFRGKSMVYNKEPLFPGPLPHWLFDDEIRIELAFSLEVQETPSFDFIVQFYDPASRERLLIGQWNRSIVIMNGDDYSNRRREPKIYMPIEPGAEVRHLEIISDTTGTRAFLDGELLRENPGLHLQMPGNPENIRLTLGCGENANNSWHGRIYGLHLYNDTGPDGTPFLSYNFSEGSGTIIHEETGKGGDLFIPSRLVILRREFLRPPTVDDLHRIGTLVDIILNLLGFIPLGLFLFLASGLKIRLKTGLNTNTRTLITLTIVFLLSLSIELYQAWIPTRSSSLLDLVLNTAGGIIGIGAVKK